MAIGVNDPIPSTDIGMNDLYICFTKALPGTSIGLGGLTDDYNDYWSPDKDPEFSSYQGVRVYHFNFPAFPADNPSLPAYSNSVTITGLGGIGTLSLGFSTSATVQTGPLITGEADCYFEENGSPFALSNAFAYGGAQTDTNGPISRSITVGSDTLTAHISITFDAPHIDNEGFCQLSIAMPSSTSFTIYKINEFSRGAFHVYV